MIEKENEKQQAKQTLLALMAGIVVSGILFGLLGVLIFSGERLAFVAGTALGTAVSCGLAAHMYQSIDMALDMDPESAKRYMRGRSTMRMGLMGITLAVALLLPEYLHVLGTFLGLMGLKTGAYLQLGILKLIEKRKEGEETC